MMVIDYEANDPRYGQRDDWAATSTADRAFGIPTGDWTYAPATEIVYYWDTHQFMAVL